MSYPLGLDEYTSVALSAEIMRRVDLRLAGKCDYCERTAGCLPVCKFTDRHYTRLCKNYKACGRELTPDVDGEYCCRCERGVERVGDRIEAWQAHHRACVTCQDADTQQDGWCISRGCPTGQKLFRAAHGSTP